MDDLSFDELVQLMNNISVRSREYGEKLVAYDKRFNLEKSETQRTRLFADLTATKNEIVDCKKQLIAIRHRMYEIIGACSCLAED